MNLQQLQTGFIACLHDPEAAPPAGWGATMSLGLEIYRNNYRSALLESMHASYERTRRWVGEAPFDAAAAHHLVGQPPSGWSLDDAGAGFAATLAVLFAHDPEVADLAALEWAMHRASIAADATALDLDRFRASTAGFNDDDWAAMRLLPLPGLAIIPVRTDCVALWRALDGSARPADPPRLPEPRAAIVWRDGWRPVCCMADAWQAQALGRVVDGASFGDLCRQLPEAAGPLLAWWIESGMLAGAQ